MICSSCNINKDESEFTIGKHRCFKCQYQYQKKRKLELNNLKLLKEQYINMVPEDKVKKLLELNLKYSIHDLSVIFNTTKHIIISELKKQNSYFVFCYKCQKCWSLENLQPLWAADNIRKSNNIGEEWGNV